MRGGVLLLSLCLAGTVSAEQIIVFVDGTKMSIQSYEVKGGVVQFTTSEGQLRSVPRSYVNLVATEEANRGSSAGPPEAPAPAPPPPRANPAPPPPAASEPELPTESVTTEPPIPAPETDSPPLREAPPMEPDLAMTPPPEWSNDELKVSLQVPSSQWRIEDMPASFDVAVALERDDTEARATLALIRQKLRGRGDFREVVEEVESSISSAPGYRAISAGAVQLDPYAAHEFRFTKTMGFVPVYNRLVIVYSKDLAYVLSLTCPENRLADNESDFEALVRGLVIRKPRNELTF